MGGGKESWPVLLFKGTDEEFLSQMVNMLLNIKLNGTENYKLIFVFDLFGNVLSFISQATFSGKINGRTSKI